MVPDSYLKALFNALRQDIESLYTNQGETFSWQAYGVLWPKQQEVYGAIALQVDDFPSNSNLFITDYSVPYKLKVEIETRIVTADGINNLGIVYDYHSFLLYYLLRDLRVNGLTGTFDGLSINKAFVGLTITKALAGVALPQDDLNRMKSLINFEWEYFD